MPLAGRELRSGIRVDHTGENTRTARYSGSNAPDEIVNVTIGLPGTGTFNRAERHECATGTMTAEEPGNVSQSSALAALASEGVSVWLDNLSRDIVHSGRLADLAATRNVVGVTTNPSIFEAAITHGDAYTAQIAELASRGADAATIVRTLTTDDVRDACDVLAPQYRGSAGVDGRVSIEVDPGLAHDTARTVAAAVELWKIVDRPNLFVKVPATAEALPAITAALAQGVTINVTLIFSVHRHRQVMQAYLAGLAAALHAGHNLAGIHSVASFFVSRVDTEVDRRLEQIGTPAALALRGKAGIANARLAYAAYREVFEGGPRFAALKTRGAQAQRPLWASTGVKNPAYRDTMYVTELVAPNTVNTMPEKTLDAVADHAQISGDTVTGTAAAAQRVFDDLTALGVDLPDVFAVLEKEGVDKFTRSWEQLLAAARRER
jgi:transaldolase